MKGYVEAHQERPSHNACLEADGFCAHVQSCDHGAPIIGAAIINNDVHGAAIINNDVHGAAIIGAAIIGAAIINNDCCQDLRDAQTNRYGDMAFALMYRHVFMGLQLLSGLV